MVCGNEAALGLSALNDMGDYYVTTFVSKADGLGEPSQKRVVLIGSSNGLALYLLRSGYRVLHIDKDPAEAEDTRKVLSENLSEDELKRFESATIDVEEADAGFRANDIVCFVRSLHHMQYPSGVLKKIYEQVGNIIVCDMSESLLQEHEKIYGAEYTKDEKKVNKQCLLMVRGHGLKDKESVEDFLVRSGFDPRGTDIQFYYRLRCPCENRHCSSVCTYWFLVAEHGALCAP